MIAVKIFVSSLIAGYEQYRAAATGAIETLGHEVVRAEAFPASAATPQHACLAAVRDADLVVLLLGARYGASQASGLSATHEESREARERTPVLVFVESGVDPDADQQTFLGEVQSWSSGHFRASYDDPDDLGGKVVRAIHDFELALSAGPIDDAEMMNRNHAASSSARFHRRSADRGRGRWWTASAGTAARRTGGPSPGPRYAARGAVRRVRSDRRERGHDG
jgi:hypothetical protein